MTPEDRNTLMDELEHAERRCKALLRDYREAVDAKEYEDARELYQALIWWRDERHRIRNEFPELRYWPPELARTGP